MYLWNTKGLAKALKQNSLNEKDLFKYFFVYLMVSALIFGAFDYMDAAPTTSLNLFFSSFTVFVTGLATYFCYKINSTGDNQKFIERYICLGIPLAVKLAFLIILLMFLLIFLSIFLDIEIYTDPDGLGEALTTISGMFAIVIFYWRMYVHMKFIAHD
ncbi:hypothetical protein JYT29_03180 [Nitrospina gracilis]|nr:hypothetical protein [Nitrospina gracilis]